MLEAVKSAASSIKKLEIQGARNVAIAAIKAIDATASETTAKSKQAFISEILEAQKILFASRETEPLMRNALRYILHELKSSKEKKVKQLAETVSSVSHRFLSSLEDSREEIAGIGAKRIHDNSTILTHCHSSTVTHMLRMAKRQGKSFRVICTETRPLFQGRKTADEMLRSGIETTLIVDSASRYFMNQVDLVIVGADAITSEGNVINKIGTSMIALAAHEARTPFYAVSELLKFDPATMYGDYEKIEERNPTEVWERPPRNLAIKNPAFDVTRRDFVHGIISEEGIISPHSIAEVVRRKHPWIFEQINR